MASLKDMRVRIASTKATQKIAKAMQMVAASKLRRAQTVAEAARPYAEKMDAVISNIAAAAAGSPGAPALLAGTGNDQVHLLLVCTGERGLCGAFNSAIVRLARERALSLINQGKEVKFFCVGRKGYEQLRRTFERQIVEHVDLRRADERDGQRHPQRRRHDPQADPDLQPHPSGDDHQGADRDHLRRRSDLSRMSTGGIPWHM